jgi:ubiquinone/menaquinone biosynthesis C-methylase UbiE
MTGIDNVEDPQALLTFLDDVAELDEVRTAKQRATEALALQPGDRVLEIGCGTGVDAPAVVSAVKPGGRLVGIDVSELAIQEAGRRMAGVPEAEMLVADAHELPFEAGSFDACRVDRTFQHLADPDRALAEVRRVLAPGGRLVIHESGSSLRGSPAVVEAAVRQAIATRYWREHEKVAQISMFLPLLLSRAGFADVRFDRATAESTNFDAAERILRLELSAKEAVEDGLVEPGAARSWLADVRRGMQTGDVTLQAESVLFVARV